MSGRRPRPPLGGGVRPLFPNAVYYFPRRQFEWAQAPSERDRAGYEAEDFLPLWENGQVKLIGPGEIFPGVRAVEVNGHTPGQLLYWFESQGKSLLFGGDLIPTASHLHLPYHMAYDLLPLETLREKPSLLDEAIAKDSLIHLYHDPRRVWIRAQKKDSRYCLRESLADC